MKGGTARLDDRAALRRGGDVIVHRLAPLESLRGVLALTVLCCHVVSFTFSNADLAAMHMSLFNKPVLAVYVFIILSGFVITLLVDQGQVSYRTFITRRFFRIFPLYWLALGAAILSAGAQLHVITSMPWTNANIVTKIATQQSVIAHFWPHLLTHVVLVQGMVSDKILPFSDFAFIGQAWSTSLEWQFYLLAPFIVWMVRGRQWRAISAIAAVFIVLAHDNYAASGFIGNQFGYFGIGIASYYLFKHAPHFTGLSGSMGDFVILASAATLYFFFPLPWSLIAWTAVLATLIFTQAGAKGVVTGAIHWTLTRPALTWLGQISYSIYLWHKMVMYTMFAVTLHFVPAASKPQFLALALPLTLVATILLSALSYKFVEKPGMRLGKWLSGAGRRQDAQLSLQLTP